MVDGSRNYIKNQDSPQSFLMFPKELLMLLVLETSYLQKVCQFFTEKHVIMPILLCIKIILQINMGGCAGCMGPSRRDENYRVNRLTQNAPIKTRVTSSELPAFKHQRKIVQQISQQKKKMDQSNLLGVLMNSPQPNPTSSKQLKLTNSILNYRQSSQSLYMKQNNGITSTKPRAIKKVESMYLNDDYMGVRSSWAFSPEKNYPVESRSPFVSDFRLGPFTRESSKMALNEPGSYRNTIETSMVLKKKTLLNIPQIPEEDARTPFYVKQQQRKNGQDVLRTGLLDIPQKLEAAPQANLYHYLKDLQ